MGTFRSNLPLGTSDAGVFVQGNVPNFDEALNSSSPEWVNRFGEQSLTYKGWTDRFSAALEAQRLEFQTFLESSGYSGWDTQYAAGIVLSSHNQGFTRCDVNGTACLFYTPKGDTPLPYTTTGEWANESGLFVVRGDDSVSQLLSTFISGLKAEGGAQEVGYSSMNVLQRLSAEVYPDDFGAIGDGSNDDTAALMEWASKTTGALALKRGSTYLCKSPLTLNSSVYGHGATIAFDIPATMNAIITTSDDVILHNFQTKLLSGPSQNPADYGDAGGVSFHIEGDNVNLSRVRAIDFVNGVQWVPNGSDINSGTITNSIINVVGRGLLVARNESGGQVTNQAKNIISSGNRYILQEENLPAGTNREGLNGILVKWPSEGFKSINDVIRNSPEHAVYGQGSSMLFENLDVSKPDSAIGDGLKLSCPDGGNPGVGRFASAIVNGFKSRGYGIGIHSQFRTKNLVLNNLDIDGSGNTLAAQSYSVYCSNPSNESEGLIGNNWRIGGNRTAIAQISIGGRLRIDGVDMSNPVGDIEAMFGVDGPGSYGVLRDINSYSTKQTGYSLYIGASIGHMITVEDYTGSGTLGPLVNANAEGKVKFVRSHHNGLSISHMEGSQIFSLSSKQFSSMTMLNAGFSAGFVMPQPALISAISLNLNESPTGGYISISIRKNYSQAIGFDIPVADIKNGHYTFLFSAAERIHLSKGDYLQFLVSSGNASWGDSSTPITATVSF